MIKINTKIIYKKPEQMELISEMKLKTEIPVVYNRNTRKNEIKLVRKIQKRCLRC